MNDLAKREWKLMPKEPTAEMLAAARMDEGDGSIEATYRALFDAAPEQDANPVAYAAFAENGRIRIWSQDPGMIDRVAAMDGFEVKPLYTSQPMDSLRRTHPDDLAVDRFAAAMKAKLAQKRTDGYGGWDDPEKCSVEYLEQLLVEQIRERSVIDPVDVGNFAMMIHQHGGRVDG